MSFRLNTLALAVLVICLAWSCSLSGRADTTTSKAIEWVKDLDTAMALSEKDGRPVIAYFTFDT